ncbi:hypothetical protein LPJ61_003543, partial [Coemansia biformis]
MFPAQFSKRSPCGPAAGAPRPVAAGARTASSCSDDDDDDDGLVGDSGDGLGGDSDYDSDSAEGGASGPYRFWATESP